MPVATVPVAVWNTFDLEYRDAAKLTKAYPSRVEIISGGTLGRSRAWYFVELRALSQQIGARNRLLNRSGRFEDAFVSVPADAQGSFTITLGQFRTLSQVDVSRRLSLSEPLAFSAGVPDRRRAASARLTSLRAFSPAGRQPGLRLMYQRRGPRNLADGFYAGVTVPLAGELAIPFTDAASFELEGRPKGLFAETYYRTGLTTFGGHAFVGDRRSVTNVVVSSDVTARWSFLAALGVDRTFGVTEARYSVGGEHLFTQHLIVGTRLDHRTGQGRRRALFVYGNGHFPFGASSWRQSLRLQFEQTLQRNNFRSAVALSHIF